MKVFNGSVAGGSLSGSPTNVIQNVFGDQLQIFNGTGAVLALSIPSAVGGGPQTYIIPAFKDAAIIGTFGGGNLTAQVVSGTPGSGILTINAVQSYA